MQKVKFDKMNKFNKLIFVIALLILFLSANFQAIADPVDPAELIKNKDIGFVTKLGTKLDTSLKFIDETGNEVSLSSILTSKIPTIFAPMYYSCPRLCGLLINGLVDLVKRIDLKMGDQYRVISFSFDPTENSELAKQKSESVVKAVDRADVTGANWHFLTGKEENIKALLEQAGYRYKFSAGEYLHSSGFFVLTPQGEISQYFTGIEFSPWDVRLSLIDASQGSIGSTMDHILLYCFDFDPVRGRYTWVAFNILRGGAAVSVVLFGIVAVMLSRKVTKRGIKS